MSNVSPMLETLADVNLDQYATSDKQAAYRRAVVGHGSITGAAAAHGVHHSTVERSCRRLIEAAARRGYAPSYDQAHPSPEGQQIRGVSTLYASNGDVKAQWVKTRASDEHVREALREFVDELIEGIDPVCLLYTSPSPRDRTRSRMPSSA